MFGKLRETLREGDHATFMRKYGIALILVLLCVAMHFISPAFGTSRNLISVLLQVSINGILALGMTFVITVGGIDLSIGSIIALTSVVSGYFITTYDSVALAVGMSLFVSVFVGFFNGFFIAHFNMFPFVVTLASQMIIRGFAYVVADGQSFTLTSTGFRQIGAGKFLDVVPYPIIVCLCIGAVSYVLLHRMKFGRYIYAVGGNIKAANAAGVNVRRVRVLAFIIMSVFTCIAGIVLSSRVNAGQPNLGIAYETDAIAACVIGGTSLNGGIGTIPGTVIGILIIGVINNGMNLLSISSYYQNVVKGSIIIGAVLLDMILTRKNSR